MALIEITRSRFKQSKNFLFEGKSSTLHEVMRLINNPSVKALGKQIQFVKPHAAVLTWKKNGNKGKTTSQDDRKQTY